MDRVGSSSSPAATGASGWPSPARFAADGRRGRHHLPLGRAARGPAAAVRCDVTDTASGRRRLRARSRRSTARSRCWSPTPASPATRCCCGCREDDFAAVLDTNLTGSFRVAKRAMRGMLRLKRGRIIFISSVVGLLGSAGPGQLRGVQGRARRLRPVARPRARLARHHRQRRRARLRRHRHDGGAGRGAARPRSSAQVPLGRYAAAGRGRRGRVASWPATTPATSPGPSSRSTAASAWATDDR